jgi:hypothetical protein
VPRLTAHPKYDILVVETRNEGLQRYKQRLGAKKDRLRERMLRVERVIGGKEEPTLLDRFHSWLYG